MVDLMSQLSYYIKVNMSEYEEVHALIRRANNLSKKQNFAQAIDLATRAIELIEKSHMIVWEKNEEAQALRIRANCFLQINALDEAIRDAGKSIDKNPNNDFSWCIRGEAYFGKSIYREAIDDLSIAIELDPMNGYALGLRACVFMKIERFDLALQDLKIRWDFEPEDAWTNGQMGLAYKGAGEYQKAIDHFRSASINGRNMEWVRAASEETQQLMNDHGGSSAGIPLSQRPIRLLIVEDNQFSRDKIREIFREVLDITIVGEAVNGLEDIKQFDLLKPDVTTMDTHMPVLDGISATKAIRKKYINAKIIMLSIQNDISYLRLAMQAGAVDYLTIPPDANELVHAIRLAVGRLVKK
jgi:CheY-like chemotaxis protein